MYETCAEDVIEIHINPFTAPACTFSGLKSAHIHACKQYILIRYNKDMLSIVVHFDRSPFTCSKGWGGGGGGSGEGEWVGGGA